MRATFFGATGANCQLNRITEAFDNLGNVRSSFEPDFIYSNDPGGFEAAIQQKEQYPRAKLILNFLDFPLHCSEFPDLLNKWREQIEFADKITAISKYTQSQAEMYFERECHLIYNPIKPVSNLNIPFNKKIIDILMVGRLNDPNKRANLAYQALRELNQNLNVAIVGSEYPGFGNYYGLVSDNDLNQIYNNSKICLALGKVEGLNLPVIESVITNSCPIVCVDSTTASEFLPINFWANPEPKDLAAKIYDILDNPLPYLTIVKPLGVKYKEQFSAENVCKRILSLV